MQEITWCEKYLLAMKESLTLKEIMKLRSVGQPRAFKIRQEAIDYCIMNNIQIEGKWIPTVAIFEVTGMYLDYYYNKMIDESKALEIIDKHRGIEYVRS